MSYFLYTPQHRENVRFNTFLRSYPCFSLQEVTCKSKYDVGVNKDCPQVYDAGVGLPTSGGPRRVWTSHVGCVCSLENIPLLEEPTGLLDPSNSLLSYLRTKRSTGFFNPDIQWLTESACTCAQNQLSDFQWSGMTAKRCNPSGVQNEVLVQWSTLKAAPGLLRSDL